MSTRGPRARAAQPGPAAAPPEQLALLRSTARRARPRPPALRPAADRPVARVVIDVPLAHLDRPFDYLVPEALDGDAQPGVRVRVRFSGRLVAGYVVDRADASEHTGTLAFLQAVVSPERVLSPEVLALAGEVARHYAGTVADVLRLAVPPRHARVEAETVALADAGERPTRPAPAGWERYLHGADLLAGVHGGAPVRAVWSALPGGTWPDEVARLALTGVAAGRGALVVVPDRRDLARVDAAVRALCGDGHHAVLTADLGPAERYRRWLAVRRGDRRLVVGTRAAMFAPVPDLGLVVVWDDGDDLHAEPRAPYPHVRTVLCLRAGLEGAALVLGGFARSTEAGALVRSGWARSVAAPRAVVRRTAPLLRTADDGDSRESPAGARLPSAAWRLAHRALERGPVLVQVPRSGYVPGLRCAGCRARARCPACAGPLGAAGPDTAPRCQWCGVGASGWSCPQCHATSLRAVSVGVERTAEELRRAFPRVRVRTSGREAVLTAVDAKPTLVLATPGAEPVADDGYAAALLLDGWALLSRPDLRAGEEALRRWMAAAALVRPSTDGGQVMVVADPAQPAVQALLRWDAATFADRELDERASLHLPPAACLVSLTGDAGALDRLVQAAVLPDPVEVLGPVPAGDDTVRILLRSPQTQRRALVDAVRAAEGVRSAHKDGGSVRVQVDPAEIG